MERPGTDPGVASAEPRIILVGRTGLETMLRPFGPVRVRRALDAIGELADPMAHGGRAGGPVVVVGADADPGAAAGGEAHATEFVLALRRVEPTVRVLRVGGGPASGAYDGSVSADGPIDDVIESMSGPGPGAKVAGAASPDTRVPPARESDARGADSLGGSILDGEGAPAAGDAELVGLMLRGLDVTSCAVRLLRERAGDAGIEFIPDGGSVAPEGVTGAEVVWQGHRFGWLAGLAGAALVPHTRWLAGWLALASQQAQLRDQAFTDPLTGAWNRRYFERFMAAALAASQRERRYLTVLVFDIDEFKRYNDDFGHAAGDAILVETVRLLRSVIRPSDKVCRIGGDEFAVIFHEPDGPRLPTSKPPESIYEIAQRFQRQICEHKFPKLGEQAPGTLTISGGLATFPWDGRTGDELLARADELALRGKRAGKNTIVIGPGATEAPTR